MSNPLLDTSSLPRFADIAPDQVMPALSELINAHREQLNSLLDNTPDPDFDSLVIPLENMEHTLSRVWSPVSHLQGVLGSTEWREAYQEALPVLTEYGTELSQNARLQQAIAQVSEALPDNASPAQRSTVEHALRNFKLAGVDLDEQNKARFREITQTLAATHAEFGNNIQDASDAWTLQVADEAELSGLPAHTIERAAGAAAERDLDGFLLTLDFPTYHAVLTHADNRALRETLYRAWSTRASDEGEDPALDNSSNIQTILSLRHESAQIIGFKNYAEYSLATKMAESPAQVIEFLCKLASHSVDAAQLELDEIREFAGGDVEAWDISYWLEKLKVEKYAISNEELRRYFPVDTAIQGLFELAGRLYGVELEIDDSIDSWHPDVLFYKVVGKNGQIGSFYADLFTRSGKRTGAWIDECVCRKNLSGMPTLPVGYLVCNFTPRDTEGQSLLTHNELVILFHEFGHMLHHLLTQVDYPSISGINGVPWDAVELPSQFMENFAWSFEVLQQCSAHADTGESLPRELFDRLEDSRHAGAALAMLRQLEFALFDFRLHTEYVPGEKFDVLGLLDEVREEVALVTHPAYNRLPHAFAHIFAGGYAAGYYSYKWAEVLAADAFAAFEEAGIFDSETAARFRTEILEVGGSRDFMEAYVAFRGREPSIDALLKQCGIA